MAQSGGVSLNQPIAAVKFYHFTGPAKAFGMPQ
jgi:hypothetical protein